MEKAKTSQIHIGLGAIGFAASLYALATHLKATVTGEALSCDVSQNVSCTKVFGSEYGEFLGIPLGAFGMAYFGIVLTVAFLPIIIEVSTKWIAQWRLLVATVGFATSALLFYVSSFKINAVCPVCSGIHVLNLILFVVSFVQFNKVKLDESVAHPNAFLKLVSTALLFATPPIIAGVIGPSIAPMIYSNSSTISATETAQPASAEGTPLATEALTFNKSNFVGKGEDYRKGADDARVVMYMWSDFQCPACRMASEGIEKATKEFGQNRVLFVYKNYPLSSTCNPKVQSNMHPYACTAAVAARCAGAQGKFWEFKNWIFTLQELEGKDLETAHSSESYTRQAETLGLNNQRFGECLKSNVEMEKIQEDMQAADKIGITGTPMIIINGRKFTGNVRDSSALIAEFEAASR